MTRPSEHLVERLEAERDELRARALVLETRLIEAKRRTEALCETLGVLRWDPEDRE